jgi:hypothetical protein
MSAAQKDAAWDVVATLMSKEGTEKTRMIMLLQDIMVEVPGRRPTLRGAVLVLLLRHASRDWHLGHAFGSRAII